MPIRAFWRIAVFTAHRRHNTLPKVSRCIYTGGCGAARRRTVWRSVVTLFIASTKLLYVEPFTAGMGGGYTTSVYNQSTKPTQPLGSLNRVPA